MRYLQRTIHESQEAARAHPDNSRDQQTFPGPLVSRQISLENIQVDATEKSAKPGKISGDKKLNELTMKQIDSMSRPNRTKVPMNLMMQPKTDSRVARPSLNQLKQLNQQQQMSKPLRTDVTEPNAVSADKRRDAGMERRREQHVTTAAGSTTSSVTTNISRKNGSSANHVSQQQQQPQQQQFQKQQPNYQQSFQQQREHSFTSQQQHQQQREHGFTSQQQQQQQRDHGFTSQQQQQQQREHGFTPQQQQQQQAHWSAAATTTHSGTMQGSMASSSNVMTQSNLINNGKLNAAYPAGMTQGGHLEGVVVNNDSKQPENWWAPQRDTNNANNVDSKIKTTANTPLPVTCAAMGSYVNAAQPPHTPTHLPVTCSAQSGRVTATTQGPISSAGVMYAAPQNSNINDPFL